MRTGSLALLATAGVLLGAALLFGGGSTYGALAWIGGAALLAALASVGAVLWGVLPAPSLGREGWVCAGCAAGFVIWNGLTIVWSLAPDRSWGYLNRGLAYLAFGVLGAFVGSLFGSRVVAWLVGVLVAVTCVWALAGKVVPALYEDYGRLARLRSPVGYWNALALVAVFGVPLALWAATRGRLVVRAGAVVALYGFFVTLVLTYSRGGVLAGLVAVGVWFWLSRERFEGLTAFVLAFVPAGLVLAVALLLPGIADDGQPRSVRVHDGAVFAVAFVLGAALAFAGAYFVRYRPGVERERFLLRAAAWGAVLVVAGGIAAVAASGNPFGSDTQIGQGPNRLAEGSLNNRWGWWKEAWHGFAAEPLGGNGAGAFELVHRKYRESAVEVQEAHSLPLQFASETGLVGFSLVAVAAGAALLGAWRALGRLGGEERAAGVALAAVLPAFLVHGALDYDWDFVALCGPVFFVSGALFAAGRGVGRVGRRHVVWAVALVLVAWAGLYSIAAPRVAAAKVDDAYAQLERGDLEQAVDSAKGAHSLDPVSVAPLEAWASAEEADGNIARARELYVQSVELQPLNWATWYELGRFDREVIGDERAARREFRRANELDPHNCAVRQALSLPCEG